MPSHLPVMGVDSFGYLTLLDRGRLGRPVGDAHTKNKNGSSLAFFGISGSGLAEPLL